MIAINYSIFINIFILQMKKCETICIYLFFGLSVEFFFVLLIEIARFIGAVVD